MAGRARAAAPNVNGLLETSAPWLPLVGALKTTDPWGGAEERLPPVKVNAEAGLSADVAGGVAGEAPKVKGDFAGASGAAVVVFP